MMADDMDSDIGVACERRITEIAETLRLQLSELSNSVFPVYIRDDSREKHSSMVSSSSKQVQEIIQDLPRPTSSEKVNCFLTDDNQQMLVSIGEEKVGLCDMASGSFGWAENMEDCGRKIGNFGEQLQETKDSVFDSVSGSELKKVGIEGTVNDSKTNNGKEIVCARNEEFDGRRVLAACKSIEVSKGSDIEEKKGFLRMEKREAENVLEAKKKQLLAKVDAGVFKDKVHVDSALGFDAAAGILGNLKGIDESFRRSLKVEVIDDTALITNVPVPKNGNDCVKVAERNRKKNEKQEVDGKKVKRPRRKGKDGRKDFETSDILKKIPHVGKDLNGVIRNGGQKNGNNVRKYTREEMEALRFANVVEQRNLWRAVYAGLGDGVIREYKDLASSRNEKNFHLKCDPSHRIGRKEDAPGILSVVGARGRWNHKFEENPQILCLISGKACSENGDAELHTTEGNEVENVKLLNSSCSGGMGDEDANSFVEEVCIEEDDSDEECASIQRPAFHVEGEPDFDSGPPEDGMEYLRRVRWEATHIPKVTVAKLDKSKFNKEQSVYMPQIPEIDKCPQHLLPLKQWEDAFLADFSELRKLLSYTEDCSVEISSKMQSFSIVHEQSTSPSQLGESTILEKFNNLGTREVHSGEFLDGSCPNNTSDQQSVANAEGSNISADPQNTRPSSIVDSSSNYPRLSAILAMDAVARVSMLRKRISLAETTSTLSKHDCVWLFALCAAIDTPLDADTSAALRSLLRKCASLRAAKSELDDEVVMLNIIATISGKYFGQSES